MSSASDIAAMLASSGIPVTVLATNAVFNGIVDTFDSDMYSNTDTNYIGRVNRIVMMSTDATLVPNDIVLFKGQTYRVVKVKKRADGNITELSVAKYTTPTPPPSQLMGFPHPLVIVLNNGAGLPVMTSSGVFDSARLDAFSRYPFIRIPDVPFTNPDNPENLGIISLIRTRNPNAKILWYSLVQAQFLHISNTRFGATWTLVAGPPDARIYTTDGTVFQSNSPSGNVFWDPNRCPGGAQDYLNMFLSFDGGKADGYWLDLFISNVCNWFGGISDNGSPITFAGTPYANATQMNAAITSALNLLTDGLLADSKYLIGNRGSISTNTPNTVMSKWTGECLERWDTDQGFGGGSAPLHFATFDDAMNAAFLSQGSDPTGDGGAHIVGDTTAAQNSAAWNKLWRYCLGSATVAGGFASSGIPSPGAPNNNDMMAWADEFSVTPAGTSETTGANIGWLGRPLDFGFKDSVSGMYYRQFDNGIVVLNGPGGTRTIDLTPFGIAYKHILGIYDTVANDGTAVTSLSVPSKDARFLINA